MYNTDRHIVIKMATSHIHSLKHVDNDDRPICHNCQTEIVELVVKELQKYKVDSSDGKVCKFLNKSQLSRENLAEKAS